MPHQQQSLLPDVPTSELPLIDEDAVLCPVCDNEFDRHEGCIVPDEHSDSPCCPECVHTCEGCDTVTTDDEDWVAARTNGYSRSGGGYSHRCPDCAWQCADCSCYFTDNVGSSRNADSEPICGRCSESYGPCARCDDTVHNDDLRYDVRISEDDSWCESCYREVVREHEEENAVDAAAGPADEDEDESRGDSTSETIHGYSYKPRPQFFVRDDKGAGKVALPGRLMFLGWELEVEAPRSRDEDGITNDVQELELSICEDIYCKHDGSLSNGVEIVSMPGTWKYWQGADWNFTDELRKRGYRSYDTVTCGMHVHVSKAALSSLDQFKLLSFLKQNATLMTRLSRRQTANLERWAQIENRPVEYLARKVKYGNDHGGRYVAINFENRRTIEFRLFRGTLDKGAIKRNLALVVALCHFVKWAGMKQLSARDFARWLRLHGQHLIGKPESSELLKWVTQKVPDESGA